MSAEPARLARLEGRKGTLAPGHDADIVVWDPEESFIVEPAELLHRHHLTPYAGRELFGRVRASYAGGRLAFGRV
jgi:allantoinase